VRLVFVYPRHAEALAARIHANARLDHYRRDDGGVRRDGPEPKFVYVSDGTMERRKPGQSGLDVKAK
jgi:hypothetical protein